MNKVAKESSDKQHSLVDDGIGIQPSTSDEFCVSDESVVCSHDTAVSSSSKQQPAGMCALLFWSVLSQKYHCSILKYW